MFFFRHWGMIRKLFCCSLLLACRMNTRRSLALHALPASSRITVVHASLARAFFCFQHHIVYPSACVAASAFWRSLCLPVSMQWQSPPAASLGGLLQGVHYFFDSFGRRAR